MAWSDEVHGLLGVVAQSGVDHVVTSVCRNNRTTSFHDQQGTNGCGLAVDFAGPTPFNQRQTHQPLLDIFNALAEESDRLAELFYSGADFYVKNGLRYPISRLSASVRDAHWNHVHSAVHRGVILIVAGQGAGEGTIGGVSDPNVHPAQSPVVNLVPTPSGNGYWIITARGEIFAFGDAQYHGRVEYTGAL